MYNVNIKSVLNGWVVKVGCQTVVFQSKDEMFNEIGAYLSNPKQQEKFYRENAVNKSLLTEPEDEEMVTMEEE